MLYLEISKHIEISLYDSVFLLLDIFWYKEIVVACGIAS